jgi:hypothetical protein
MLSDNFIPELSSLTRMIDLSNEGEKGRKL